METTTLPEPLTKTSPRLVVWFVRTPKALDDAKYDCGRELRAAGDDQAAVVQILARRGVTSDGFVRQGWFGCSDEWLAGNPDWATSPDGPDVMGRLSAPLSRRGYPEGDTVEVRAVVHDLRGGVIADRTWTFIGAGEPVDTAAAAKALGIAESTLRSYRSRGQFPEADYPTDAHGTFVAPSGPHWKESTILHFKDNRPGPGARTDLKRKS